ncbi:MAG: hypothetical protein KDC98_06605 [Planctomycetes bacterium]|nr:hypothetical protein [Planctomycetota bacterium]
MVSAQYSSNVWIGSPLDVTFSVWSCVENLICGVRSWAIPDIGNSSAAALPMASVSARCVRELRAVSCEL